MSNNVSMKKPSTRRLVLLCLAAALVVPGCQTLREVANLRFIDFAIDDVTQARLAGVELDRIRGYRDLSAVDVLRIGAAVADEELPLSFQLHLGARNPAENQVQARLVAMDWTLFLEDRETISGTFDREVVLPPGQTVDIPIRIELDLVQFFGRNAQDLVELALAVAGQDGGRPKNVRLEAVPSIQTPIGALRYPQPITIVSRDVGAAR